MEKKYEGEIFEMLQQFSFSFFLIPLPVVLELVLTALLQWQAPSLLIEAVFH